MSPVQFGRYVDGEWVFPNGAVMTPPAPPPAADAPSWSNTLVLDEQWATLDTTKWDREIGTYGSNGNRIQYYLHANCVVSPASSGGNGNSLKLVSKRETVGSNNFTAGMVSTRGVGVYYPRYGRYEARMRIPHGHGVWPAFWLRHRDGSSICEPDIMEYFIAQEPGKVGPQLHRTNNAGTFQTNRMPWTHNGIERFEVYEPPVTEGAQGWVTISMDILPWTAGTYTGGSLSTSAGPNTNVAYIMRYNGVQRFAWVDNQSTNWTTRYDDQAFDITLQGSQIGGDYIGHPDDPVGYSRWLSGGSCVVGGTAPNGCTTTVDGLTNIAPVFPNTFEIDYVKVWRYTP